jgi:hypothetical protein
MRFLEILNSYKVVNLRFISRAGRGGAVPSNVLLAENGRDEISQFLNAVSSQAIARGDGEIAEQSGLKSG